MEFVKHTIAKSVAFTFVLGIAACTQAQNSIPTNTAPGNGFAVVELFTSEGCSSCPPADELIDQLQSENPNLPLYILAYHVDYWDHQGWKDRFSNRSYTNRQQQYLNWLNLETLYTPQIVVNGKTENVGSNGKATVNAINDALTHHAEGNISLTAVKKQEEIEVNYQYSGSVNNTSIVLALVQKNAESNVTAGENSGRRLPHVQIVRQLKEEDTRSTHSISIKAPADFKTPGWELIAFVQNKKNGQIIAANKSSINQ